MRGLVRCVIIGGGINPCGNKTYPGFPAVLRPLTILREKKNHGWKEEMRASTTLRIAATSASHFRPSATSQGEESPTTSGSTHIMHLSCNRATPFNDSSLRVGVTSLRVEVAEVVVLQYPVSWSYK